MNELIGCCTRCRKEVYCLNGFLNGVHKDSKEIFCFECYEKLINEKENPQK
jgi:hypothetical protein